MPKHTTSHPLSLAAALIGTLPVSLFGPMATAKLMPLSPELRAVVALYAPLPLYALLATLTVRLRWRWAWTACLAGSVASLLLAGG